MAEGMTTMTTNETPDETGMTDDEKRRDQLLAAPGAVEDDAAPRIDVTDRGDGIKRIDIRDDAAVRPGDPTKDPED
ncbi:hypothetical protein FB391_3199 [Microbacterium kyungheense]|uniref:Multidrug transporter n=2 Tax=Microbacterium kyungheense TaxID=1263636 RepID=A0A543EQK4_9MICO|nr:hypothetical protein FB391_3199 [Microbacterium kyungheense]